jgi:hypothetical protein
VSADLGAHPKQNPDNYQSRVCRRPKSGFFRIGGLEAKRFIRIVFKKLGWWLILYLPIPEIGYSSLDFLLRCGPCGFRPYCGQQTGML